MEVNMKTLILTALVFSAFLAPRAHAQSEKYDLKKTIRCFGSVSDKDGNGHKVELKTQPYTIVGVLNLSAKIDGYAFSAEIKSRSAHSLETILQDSDASVGLIFQSETNPGFFVTSGGKMDATGYWNNATIYSKNLNLAYSQNQKVGLTCSINDTVNNP
jgi:hypothetical protein